MLVTVPVGGCAGTLLTIGGLLTTDVEVQAVACRGRVDQGLRRRWRGPVRPCLPAALQRDRGGKPGAYRAQRPRPGRCPRRYGGARPPLSAAMFWPRWRRILLRRGIGGPGGPAEGEGAVDQGLVAADREVGADLETGPARLVFDLLAALLDPGADRVDPHDLGQAGGRVR